MTVLVEEMMKLRPRSDFAAAVARFGIRRSDLAKAANLSTQTIHRLAKPQNYRNNDKGYVTEVSAWRVARAFATLADVTPDQAFETLFEADTEE
jgi:hypothetical protein